MNNFRDIENLSAYLDGELSEAESKRLETRLANDPQLASVLSDLRSARGILRKLPKRKAPRNFTLTRQMVGLKPPLPRSYGFVRFSTAFATVLLVISFAFNFLTLNMNATSQAPATAYGMGGGGGAPDESFDTRPQSGGGGDSEESAIEAPAAAEESAASDLAPAPTVSAELYQSVPAESPTPEGGMVSANGEQETSKITTDESEAPQQPQGINTPNAAFNWNQLLFGMILLGLVVMFVMHQSASRKWR